MSEKSAKSFLNLLKRSGIVAEDRLSKALSELSKNAGGRKVNTDELTRHLIESGLITNWHYEKILEGKYKGFFLGKYKLLGHLGTGGMSSVYLGEHKITGQKRALKVLPKKKIANKSFFERFYREAKAAASLNHPNIVRMYDISSEDDTHFMVMEYVQGEDLQARVKRIGPLDYDEALDYTAQTAMGLQHAHERRLVHRDIKPANLLVSDDKIKILDLGLALDTDDEESLTVLHNEKVMGTADYLSPEQAVNSHEVDHRTDIYSLGCTLYFMLTGHPPFPEGSLAQRVAMHQTKEPEEITTVRPDCPNAILTIAKGMMHKKPDERYQSCQDVMNAITLCRSRAAVRLGVTDDSGDGNEVPPVLPAFDGAGNRSHGYNPNVGSQAEIRTDEIATRTVESPIHPGPRRTPRKSSPGKINTRRRKSKSNAGLWFGILIAIMLALLVGIVFAAVSLTGGNKTTPGKDKSASAVNTSAFESVQS